MYQIGDTVTVLGGSWPGKWTIIKINPKTYKLESQQGAGILNASHSLVMKVDSDSDSTRVHYERPEGLRVGAIVTLKRDLGHGFVKGIPMVVIKDAFTQVNIVQVGGNAEGRYYRVSPQSLNVVKFGE